MFRNQDRFEKMAFNDAILSTFGKIDQRDIQAIDGNADRLLSYLVKRYDWSVEAAELKVERFRAKLLARSRHVLKTANSSIPV